MSRPKRILVIDREPRLTAMVNSALATRGDYIIRQENYRPEVVEAALDFRPDLVLVHAVAEHLEVDAVAQQIHAEQALHDVPVFCLTRLSANGQIGTIGFLGGYTFLANPFYLQEMVNCIAEILKSKRSRG